MVSIMKFTQCVKDTCVYTKISKNNNIIMFGLFVDDITTFYDVHDEHEYNVYINMLKQKYEMSDLGDVHNILGMRVTNRDDGLYLDQHTYIEEKLKYFNMINCNPMSTPESTTKLSSISNDNNNNNNNNDIINEYRSIVGSLIYAAISTRPDINHAVNMVSRYMHNPTHDHMIAAKRILRYMSCTKDICIKYNKNTNSNNKNVSHEKYVKNKNNNNEKQNICTNNFDVDTHEYEVDNESMSTMMTQEIVKEDIHKNKNNNNNKNIINVKAFCDADWGGDHEDRKSTTGYCVFINDNVVSWNTQKQKTVALSSAEAEYMSGSDVVKELLWLRMILNEMKYDVVLPIIVYCDNQSAIRMIENDVDHSRTKHIDIKYNFLRETVKKGIVRFEWISTKEQVADIFTKGLSKEIYEKLRDKLVNRL